MAVVPTAAPTVENRPAATVYDSAAGATPEAFGMAQANALGHLGTTVGAVGGELGGIAARLNYMSVVKTATEAANNSDANDLNVLFSGDNPFFGLKGDAAVQARQPTLDALKKNRDDVLATLTPPEYARFRDALGQSSGFQSWQYRCIEFSMGNKNAAMLQPHAHRPDLSATVQAAYEAPSLYDECLRLLKRRGLDVPASHTERDWRLPYAHNAAVEQAWLTVYRQPEQHWDLYQLGEELTDLEDAFRLWRFRHLTTVERVIGFKRGTGGTGGVSYLRKMLDTVLFPEIWALRTEL